MTDPRWHEPAFRLKRCLDGLARESGDGYFVNAGDDTDQEAVRCMDEFSTNSCELCDSPLAGSRSCAVRIHPKEENLYYAVCEDCVYVIEYGQLDDDSMAEIEDEDAQDRR